MMDLRELERYFENVKWHGSDSFVCSSPLRRDSDPSLRVDCKNGKILIKDFSSHATTEEVLAAVGLSPKQVFGSIDYKPPSWRNGLKAEYRYYSPKGKYLYSKLRYEGADGKKKIRYGEIYGDIKKSDKKPPNTPLTLYRLDRLQWAITKGLRVYSAEGEKDVDTLTELKFFACTAGGVSDWKSEHARFFRGAKLTILQDNDKSGAELTNRMLNDLKGYCHSIRVGRPSSEDKGDVTDFLEHEGSVDDLKALIDKTPSELAPWCHIVNKGKENQKTKINPSILQNYIIKNDKWFKITGNTEASTALFFYSDGVYKRLNSVDVKGIIRQYIPSELLDVATLNNTFNLMTSSAIESIKFDDLNTEEEYINFKNGIYNLKTQTLEQHTHKFKSTIQLNCNYYENSKQPTTWLKFIDDLCTSSDGIIQEDMKMAIQEWLGICISNRKGYKIKGVFLLYSPLGNTGKSVFMNILRYIVGSENTANVSMQELGDKQGAGRWATGKAYGKRLIIVGDQDSSDISSSSVFKQITGGDAIGAEFKGGQNFDYIFNGVIAIACNNLPTFKDDKGGHMLDRLNIFKCENSIPKEKRIPGLLDTLKGEADGIVKWAIDGLNRFISNGDKFTHCASSEEAKRKYGRDSDTLYDFLSHYYDITGNIHDHIRKVDFYKKYKNYCDKNERTPISSKNMPIRMESHGVPLKEKGRDGYDAYIGIKEKEFIELDCQIGFED